MGPIVSAIGNGFGRPGCPRRCAWRIDPFVAIHRRIGNGANGRGMSQHAAKKVITERRNTPFILLILEQVSLAGLVLDADVHVAAVASQIGEGLWHDLNRCGPNGDRLSFSVIHIFYQIDDFSPMVEDNIEALIVMIPRH